MKIYSVLLLVFSLFLASCSEKPFPKYEARAIWMSRFDYAFGRTAEQSRNYIRSYFEQARKSNFNIIYFQVRGNADALYHSAYEPWSKILTGTLGADPGWDPLQFAIDRAREQGLELHAWINTFPAWRSGEKPPTASIPEHPYRAHPEWVVCDSSGKPMNPKIGYITFSPGIPEVQQHIQKVLADIVGNYRRITRVVFGDSRFHLTY